MLQNISSAVKKYDHALTVLISDENLAIQHLVVSQYVVKHLLVKVLRWRLERDFHPASLLWFQVYVAKAFQ